MSDEELEARIQRLVNDRAFVLNWRAELAIVVREAERRGAERMRSAAVARLGRYAEAEDAVSAECAGGDGEDARTAACAEYASNAICRAVRDITALDIDAVLQEEP
jgi:hypothetical protein